jgi:ApaG protein
MAKGGLVFMVKIVAGSPKPSACTTIKGMAPPTIRISVTPQYLPDQSSPIDEVYAFAYTIAVMNEGEAPAQLIARHWVIKDEDAHVEEVKGLGVVGHQPFLKPGEHFEYTSGCRLRTPTGSMRGSFKFVDEEGSPFDVAIAEFELDATGRAGKSRRVH